MSRAGMRAAADHGRALPRYGSREEAERALFAQRDVLLDRLGAVAPNSASFRFDFTPESLKSLERWYFELHELAAFGKIGLSRETFERCIAMYFGEVVVKNHAEFKWAVQEFAFEPGRYEIGVIRGTVPVMLKRESIWREYRRWVS